MPRRPAHAAPVLALALAVCVLAIAGCNSSSPTAGSARGGGAVRIRVIAAENFWGAIAAQLAGERGAVRSLIVDPSTDPHSYQPSARDARALAGASMVIVNGLGYDDWASQLLKASPQSGRAVLNVGALMGLPAGANPHRWYFPQDVRAVIAQIVRDYDRLDPRDASYFAARQRSLETVGLARYDGLRREIRARYGGVAVGYSESIFQGLGEDLGLRLVTPYSFVKAIAEGTDVTAGDKQTVDAQARARQFRVWVYNSQNVTPDVRRVNQIAIHQQIPIATVTETLSPASASFEQWQVGELEALLRALRQGSGR